MSEFNIFKIGQRVICINDNFPYISKYGGSGEAKDKPKLHEELVIDDILGDFLMFEKYNTEDSINWWKDDRFAPLDAIEEIEKLLNGEPSLIKI